MNLDLMRELCPMRRDLVSDGYDAAMARIARDYPLTIHKYPTGEPCWDWTIPPKWTVRDAQIIDGNHTMYIDGLGIMSYSMPINLSMSLDTLYEHIHTNPAQPKSIPFEFKYYERNWGLCIPDVLLPRMKVAFRSRQSEYIVVEIDSEFTNGELKVGEWTIHGERPDTIVLCAHLDHPFQANDGLSGVIVGLEVMMELVARGKRNYTYTLLIVPETIGSIAYLSHKKWRIGENHTYGVFLEMMGNDNRLAFQRTLYGDALIDEVARDVLERFQKDVRQPFDYDFRELIANDEIVWNHPSVNVPMISLARYPYPEYHTSVDDMSIISGTRMQESVDAVLKILDILDANYTPHRQFTGIPFLTKHDLWVDWRTQPELNKNIDLLLTMLEGRHTIFDIARELQMDFWQVKEYVDKMKVKGLVE